jgi:hypothetical protein
LPRPSYVANYIPSLIRQGHTATSALRSLRDSGHQIADKTFYRLWGETVDHLSKAEAFVDTPLNRRPSVDQIGIATRPRARGYLYNVEIAVHNPDSGEVAFHSWGVRSQKLISIGNALQQAVNSWTDSQLRGRGTPEGRALGGTLSSVLQLVGEGE